MRILNKKENGMRMWMVNPTMLCRKHLLGEHVECHMFSGTIAKGTSMIGYIDNGLVEVHNIISRHNELAKEIEIRGYQHKSPLQICLSLLSSDPCGKVDRENSIKELTNRCPDCRARIERRTTCLATKFGQFQLFLV